MDIKELQQLIENRRPVLRAQLIRRYVNETLVDDALDYAFTTLLLKPDLFNPTKGIFNTYYFNVASNQCKTEFERMKRFVSLSEPEVDIDSYYDWNPDGSLESYQRWLFTTYPELEDTFIYDPANDANPYAEEKLVDVVKDFAATKLGAYAVPGLDLYGVFGEASDRVEALGGSIKSSWGRSIRIASKLRAELAHREDLIHEWGLQMAANLVR